MTAQIRTPTNPQAPWLPDYNRNVERAIDEGDASLEARISALEAEMSALTDAAESMATALSSLEQIAVATAAMNRTALHLLSELVGLTRGDDDGDDDEVTELIEMFTEEQAQ